VGLLLAEISNLGPLLGGGVDSSGVMGATVEDNHRAVGGSLQEGHKDVHALDYHPDQIQQKLDRVNGGWTFPNK
jgi:hypothetical protein